jgi:hypothetical protein
MPPEQQNQGQPQAGDPAASHPSFELKATIDRAQMLQLVSESQLILQNLLAHQEVFDSMSVFYPKTFQSIVALVMAFENLSVLLQEVGALQDAEEVEPEEKEAPKKKQTKSPKTEVKGSGRHKPSVGEEKQVQISGRLYRRIYGPDHKWHYKAKEHA